MFEAIEISGGYYKTLIVERASLHVGRGEIVALLGRNGVGKSTLMRCFVGQATAMGGSARLDGRPLPKNAADRARNGLGYVPQGRFVFPRLSVSENIAVAAVACGHSSAEAIDWAFVNFPALVPKARELAGRLSGGQQQILAMARALATRPKLLLLDEPTEGVQPSIVDEIAQVLLRLRRDGLAVLVAEQDLNFCLSIAERAYVMDRGRIVRETSKAELQGDKALLQELLGV
ncbi:ABC transporter ATP-binding protein [Variovorax sp. J2P1-59]|uniref:ABC transporter ATP-binding protein n=1 Tax=Variovorax flavidus TaxID=3053501 RepID=UPI002574F671|nr:ABC transporter ATP-binding protein [Variovorax sp. J2P1-59]MDM0078733.1 ABC transporter ATP-binding protein [Variovorax sp. J2P1-59]